jgi:hypothetical protein
MLISAETESRVKGKTRIPLDAPQRLGAITAPAKSPNGLAIFLRQISGEMSAGCSGRETAFPALGVTERHSLLWIFGSPPNRLSGLERSRKMAEMRRNQPNLGDVALGCTQEASQSPPQSPAVSFAHSSRARYSVYIPFLRLCKENFTIF